MYRFYKSFGGLFCVRFGLGKGDVKMNTLFFFFLGDCSFFGVIVSYYQYFLWRSVDIEGEGMCYLMGIWEGFVNEIMFVVNFEVWVRVFLMNGG